MVQKRNALEEEEEEEKIKMESEMNQKNLMHTTAAADSTTVPTATPRKQRLLERQQHPSQVQV